MNIEVGGLERLTPGQQAKFVIVGGGPVGIYLAYCLSQAGQSVVLIEAGGRIVDSSRNEVATQSVGAAFIGYLRGRTFGLGGTSAIWGGQLSEFERADFAAWPIPFEEVQSRYARVYRDLSVTPQAASAYRARLGGETVADDEIERIFTHWLPQQNFAKIFRKEVVQNPDITVLLESTVNGITFEGDRAVAVSVSNAAGEISNVTGTHFVFCNGTLEVIRFFLSTARAGNVPWRDNKEIGKRFQDHPTHVVATAEIIDETRFRNYFENAVSTGAVKLHPKLRLHEHLRTPNDVGVCGFFSFRSDIQENLGHIKWLLRSLHSGAQDTDLRTLPRDILTLLKVFLPVAGRFIRHRRIMAFFDRSVDFIAQCEQVPDARSEVRLTDEAHPVPGLYGIEIDWQLEPQALVEAIRRFTLSVDRYLQAQGLARLAIDKRVEAADPGFVSSMLDFYHHAGGMCMSASPSDGVVDTDGRVWGTSNVYVSGASIFPSSSYANPTFTALAVTARLADILLGEAVDRPATVAAHRMRVDADAVAP
jgi:choline dehydrogenase-like flavoprotein